MFDVINTLDAFLFELKGVIQIMMTLVELVESNDDLERGREALAMLKSLLGGKTTGFYTFPMCQPFFTKVFSFIK